MPKVATSLKDASFLTAALEGLELQKNRIEDQIRQVRAMLRGQAAKPSGPASGAAPKPARKRRELSAAARRRIAQAQKKRWAEYRKQKAAAAKAG